MKYDKLIKEQPKLVERVLDAALGIAVDYQENLAREVTLRKEGYNAQQFINLYKAAKPQEYMLFGKIPVVGEPPMSKPPERNQHYWAIDLMTNDMISRFCWVDTPYHKNLFNRGLVWATEEGVVAAAKALGWCLEPADIPEEKITLEMLKEAADECKSQSCVNDGFSNPLPKMKNVQPLPEKPDFQVGDKVHVINRAYNCEITDIYINGDINAYSPEKNVILLCKPFELELVERASNYETK